MSTHASTATRSQTIDDVELTRSLQAALASPSYRPPLLPAVALEVMQLAQAPEVELGDVVKLLERDPVLAARVLARAQTAHYARRSPVMTLRQAAVRLGVETLSHLVLQAALELQVFRAPGQEWLAERLNRHATAAAHVTREVCRRAGIGGEHAFTCGLLHDIGLSACLLVVSERPEWRGLPFEVLEPVLDAVHPDASFLLAQRWKLPEPLPAMLAAHHDVKVEGVVQPIHAALIVAEQLCWEAGVGIAPPPRRAGAVDDEIPEQPAGALDANLPAVVEEACRVVGFDHDAMVAAREQAFEVVESLGFGVAKV